MRLLRLRRQLATVRQLISTLREIVLFLLALRELLASLL